MDSILKEYLETWGLSLSNEIGRLSQGVRNIRGNNAFTCLSKEEVSHSKKVAYANMVCNYRPLKEGKYRVRLTIGGDVLYYHNNKSSPAALLLEVKLLLNSVISDADKGTRFMTAYLKDFFPNHLWMS